jgi:hypothetical protein
LLVELQLAQQGALVELGVLTVLHLLELLELAVTPLLATQT